MSKVELFLTALSGTIAAGLAADSVLFALRNPPLTADGAANSRGIRVKRLGAKWRTVLGYTGAQELSLGAYEVSVFGAAPADYGGGTDVAGFVRVLGPDTAMRASTAAYTVLQAGNARIATTAGLTHVGTPTVAAQPFAWAGASELAAGAAVGKGGFDLVWEPSAEGTDNRKGLVVLPGRGIVIRNPVALGAGGTGRLFVELYFEEA
jgi:hypothetical protein